VPNSSSQPRSLAGSHLMWAFLLPFRMARSRWIGITICCRTVCSFFFSNSLFARSVFGFHRSRRGVIYLSFLSTPYALRSLGDLVLKIHAYEPPHRATCLYSKNFWDRLQKLWNSAIRCQVVKYRMFFRQNCSLTLHRWETGTIVDRKAVHSINHQTKN